MTQEELAEEVDITRTYLSMIECGRKDIKASLLAKIAEALGTNVNALLFGLQQHDQEDYVAEIGDILYVCTPAERAVILETIRTIQASLIRRRGTL